MDGIIFHISRFLYVPDFSRVSLEMIVDQDEIWKPKYSIKGNRFPLSLHPTVKTDDTKILSFYNFQTLCIYGSFDVQEAISFHWQQLRREKIKRSRVAIGTLAVTHSPISSLLSFCSYTVPFMRKKILFFSQCLLYAHENEFSFASVTL